MFHRYRPETTDMLRICLGDCPDDMEVEVHPGVPLAAKPALVLPKRSTAAKVTAILRCIITLPELAAMPVATPP